MDQNLSVEATPVEPLTYDDKNPQVNMYCDRQSHHTRLRQSVEMQKREKNKKEGGLTYAQGPSPPPRRMASEVSLDTLRHTGCADDRTMPGA